MTRYFLDTEFIDDGKTVDMISIGIVCEDGREYYAQSTEFLECGKPNKWVKEYVIPHLDNEWTERRTIRDEILAFMDIENYGKPELWGWCSAYDWIALCQLFGTMMDIPDGWPHYICDIQYLLDKHNIADSALPLLTGRAHNALDDARQIEAIYEFLEQHETSALEQLAKQEKERESARHLGRLYIDPFCGPEGLEIPIYGTIYDNIAMINTAIDTWKNHLRLPGHYAITGVFFDVARGHWVLLIESNQFPEVPRDEYPPLLSIAHQRLEDGSIKFLELKIVEKG